MWSTARTPRPGLSAPAALCCQPASPPHNLTVSKWAAACPMPLHRGWAGPSCPSLPQHSPQVPPGPGDMSLHSSRGLNIGQKTAGASAASSALRQATSSHAARKPSPLGPRPPTRTPPAIMHRRVQAGWGLGGMHCRQTRASSTHRGPGHSQPLRVSTRVCSSRASQLQGSGQGWGRVPCWRLGLGGLWASTSPGQTAGTGLRGTMA